MRRRLTAHGTSPAPAGAVVRDGGDVADFARDLGADEVMLKAALGGYDGRGVWVVRPGDPFPAPGPLLAEERVDFTASSPSWSPAARTARRRLPGGPIDSVRRHLPRGDRAGARPAARPCGHRAADRPADRRGARRGGHPGGGDVRYPGRSARQRAGDASHTTRATGRSRARAPASSSSTCARSSTSRSATRARWRPLRSWRTCSVARDGENGLYGGYLHCLARDPALRIHAYGKEVRPGRKVGHVTALGSDLAETLCERGMRRRA